MSANISEKTTVPLSWFAIAVTACCTGAWASALFFRDIQSNLKEIKKDMMPRTEVAEWSYDLQVANPSLKVPRVRLQAGKPEVITEVAGSPIPR